MEREIEISQLKDCISTVQKLSPKCWDDFLFRISFNKLAPQDYFSKELSRTSELAFIISGLVRIYTVDEEGIEWNQSLLRENEFIMASLNHTIPSPVNIQAIFETSILTIPFNDFMKLAKVYPELAQLMQKLANQYLEKEKARNDLLMIKKSKERLLHFKSEFPDVYDKIPKEHIASYIGVNKTDLIF